MNTTCPICSNPIISLRSYVTGRMVHLDPRKTDRGIWDVQGGCAVGSRKQPSHVPHTCPNLFATGVTE